MAATANTALEAPHGDAGRDESPGAMLVASLKQVLRWGLPLRPDMTLPAGLLALPSVTARSVDPTSQPARVDALQRLLADLLRVFEPVDRREAAQRLFGLHGRGRSLTERRRDAATALGYNLDHLRKRIEPEMLRQFAWLIERDALQYRHRGYDGEPFAPSGHTPSISAEDLAERSDTEREILLSRLWSAVYGLRAELLTREDVKRDPDWYDTPAAVNAYATADCAAKWQLGLILTHLDAYVERYGRTILQGDATYDAEALIRLAGWTGEVSREEARELRLWVARGQ